MTTYKIPNYKLYDLINILKKYQKKTNSIKYELGAESVEDGILYYEVSGQLKKIPVKITCTEVKVEGSYKINGWSFVGTIEFTENGNIIRLADNSFEDLVPEKYLHTPKICEHCGTIRNRKDTYLIYNESTKEFKQVGSSCLLDYTQGLDANECANIMSCLNRFQEFSEADVKSEEFFSSRGCNSGISSDIVKKHAIALVKAKGYRKSENGFGTARDLGDFLFDKGSKMYEEAFGNIELASDEEVKAVDEYAKAHIEDRFGYMRNASLAWLKDYTEYRDFGLICSFVYTYLKEVAKQEVASNQVDRKNEFVGEVGEKISFNVSSMRLLYTGSTQIAYRTYAYTYCYEFISDEGNTFIWKSSNELGDAKRITATVKAHSYYRDIKQTIITRGKVVA